MSITDELRDYALSFKNSNDSLGGIGDDLDQIADRIDEEHEEKVSYWQGACYEDGYKEGLEDNEGATAEHGLLERMELLTTSLRNDYGIDASWDGLRRLWTIELTEDGCLMRDRACKAEAENAKLRELVQDIYGVMWACAEQRCTHRHDGCFRVHGNHGDICVSERCWYEDRMSELGIEV